MKETTYDWCGALTIKCPIGYKIVGFRLAKNNEIYLDGYGTISTLPNRTTTINVIILEKLPEIPGFEYTGEYREVNSREWFYVDCTKEALQCRPDYTPEFKFHIMRKIELTKEQKIANYLKDNMLANTAAAKDIMAIINER